MKKRLRRLFGGTAVSRALFSAVIKLGLPKLIAAFLSSPMSRLLIPRYTKKHKIPMSEFPYRKYGTFAEFFARKKDQHVSDPDPTHFISPCDGWLSVFPILDDCSFRIKGSSYRICDLIDDEETAKRFSRGVCMIFRLSPSDYHHYTFVDDGYIGDSHHIAGLLHSVQPIFSEAFPVYRLNRRCWNVIYTENFGEIIQIEVGALAVGGIVNEKESTQVRKGELMGHFELNGSTIVILLHENMIELLPEIKSALRQDYEYRVTQGMFIATKKDNR